MGVVASAIVCTRNRGALLEKCLDSLLEQSLARDQYEIIVVDNGSTDSTPEVVARYAATSAIVALHEPVAGLSRARNRGWRTARGQYICYIDDDAVAARGWLEHAVWAFDNVTPQPDWVAGPVELDWESPAPEWINDELAVPLGRIDWGKVPRRLTAEEFFVGANSCFSRLCLERHGGFDERLGRQGANLLSGEETQLKQRIEAAGGFLYYHPEVRVRHYVPTERSRPAWFYRRYFWGGVSDFFMRRTLTGTSTGTGGSPSDTEGRSSRLMRNLACSFGLGVTKTRTIHARIYLAYVAGWLSGACRWRNS